MKKGLLMTLAAVILTAAGLILSGQQAESSSCNHQWQIESTKPATCTKEGKEKYRCALCGETKTEIIPALGHEWGACVMLQKATCTQEGIIRCYCTRNKKHHKDTITPALGHDRGPWVIRKNATLFQPGLKTQTCGRCGDTQKRESPPLIRQESYAMALLALLMIMPMTIH